MCVCVIFEIPVTETKRSPLPHCLSPTSWRCLSRKRSPPSPFFLPSYQNFSLSRPLLAGRGMGTFQTERRSRRRSRKEMINLHLSLSLSFPLLLSNSHLLTFLWPPPSYVRVRERERKKFCTGKVFVVEDTVRLSLLWDFGC